MLHVFRWLHLSFHAASPGNKGNSDLLVRAFSSSFPLQWPKSKNSHSGLWVTQFGQNQRGEIHILPQLTTHTPTRLNSTAWPQTHIKSTQTCDCTSHRPTQTAPTCHPHKPQMLKALIRPCKSLNIHLLLWEVGSHGHAHTHTETKHALTYTNSKHKTLHVH